MSDTDSRFTRGSLVGNATLPLLTLPQIRGSIRRSNPDGGHTQPYWSGLAGTSLTIEVGTVTGGILSTATVNFSTNNYNDAVAAVNAAAPTHVRWLEADGFACIQDVHSGGKNYMRITGGTAAAILGISIDPIPGGYSRAGDLAPAPADKLQSNPQTAELLSHDENLTSSAVNRAIVGSLRGVDQALADLDREVAVWRTVDCVFEASGGLRLNLLADPSLSNLRVSSEAVAQALADGYAISDIVQVLSTTRQAYYAGTPATRLLATDLTYGPGAPSTGAITWGTGAGRRIYPTAAVQSVKQTAVNITAIKGATVTASTALFKTNQVQPGDHVLITSSNNDAPFNHNGEFVVEAVPSETDLVLRPLGPAETKVAVANDAPPALNTALGSGLSYGSIAVYVGWGFRLSGKAGTATDSLRIQTNQSDTAGLHAFVRLPVASSLREVISNGLIDNASFTLDSQIAYKNMANEFLLRNQFDSGVTLPTMPANAGLPLLARLLTPFTSGDDPRYVLMSQSNGIDVTGANYPMRLYFNRETGGIIITTNSKHNRGTDVWSKDVNGSVADRVDIGPAGIKLFHQTAGDNAVITSEAWPQIPLTINSADLATTAGALVPRFLIPSSSTGIGSTKYNLLFENKNTDSSAVTRFYIKNDTGGYAITMNARWDNSNWNKDVTGVVASKFELDGGGTLRFLYRQSGTSAPWGDSVGSGWNGVGSFADDIVNGSATLLGQIGLGTALGTTPIFNLDGSAHSPDLSKLLRTATSTGRSSSIYVSPGGDFYFSYDCHWDQTSGTWISEVPTTGGGSVVKLSKGRLSFLQKAGGTSWTDADPGGAGWDTMPIAVNSTGPAVQGFGLDLDPGIQGTGGATSGAGVQGIGGLPDGSGVIGVGRGIGPGVRAVTDAAHAQNEAVSATSGSDIGLTIATRDSASNLGRYYDWGGLPGGRIAVLNENWFSVQSIVNTSIAADSKVFTDKWTWKAGATGSSPIVSTQFSGLTARSNSPGWINGISGVTATAYTNIHSTNQIFNWNSQSQLHAEFEITNFTSGVSSLFFGLSQSPLLAMPANANFVIGVGARSTDTKWQIVVSNGTTRTFIPTTFNLPSGTFAYLRVEILGLDTSVGTALGAPCIRFFASGLSDNAPITVSTGLPTARTMFWNNLEVMSTGMNLVMGGLDIAWRRKGLPSNIAY